MSAGRPSEYTPQIADELCAELASGRSLRRVCEADSMPCVKTVFNWMRTYPEFLQRYEKAKEESADLLAEEMLDIADDGSNDWMEKKDKEGAVIGWQVNGEHVQRSRLRLDARKWIASKLKPKKYGDKLELGGDPKSPIVHNHVFDPAAISAVDGLIGAITAARAGKSDEEASTD